MFFPDLVQHGQGLIQLALHKQNLALHLKGVTIVRGAFQHGLGQAFRFSNVPFVGQEHGQPDFGHVGYFLVRGAFGHAAQHGFAFITLAGNQQQLGMGHAHVGRGVFGLPQHGKGFVAPLGVEQQHGQRRAVLVHIGMVFKGFAQERLGLVHVFSATV